MCHSVCTYGAPECEFHGTFTGPQTFLFCCFFPLFEMEKNNTPHSWLKEPYKSSPAGDSEECVPCFLPPPGLGGFLMGIKPSLLWLCF